MILPVFLLSLIVKGQDSTREPAKPTFFSYDSLHQVDIMDVAHKLLKKKKLPEVGAKEVQSSHPHFSVLPAVGYSLQTGWAAILSGNVAFNSGGREGQNISTLIASFTYSQYKQFIIPLVTSIWSKNGNYNFQSEWRFLQYPSFTYGLGTQSSLQDGYRIDYSYMRLHQNISRRVSKNLYAGLGIYADFYWDIKEINPDTVKGTDFENYGFYKKEKAIGPAFSLLYDSRNNPLNPESGAYLNLSYQPKFKFMGSHANWQSVLLEGRAYKTFPKGSDNIIAIWSYNWFTFGGRPPYLLLPSTGWDVNVNTGRGYIQGRFRGSDMLYLESEYRFLITSNGLVGGVVFANAETFSSRASTLAHTASFASFDPVQPGYGLGVRIRLNKFSRANLCVDYGFGTGGSRGVAVNLGEVF